MASQGDNVYAFFIFLGISMRLPDIEGGWVVYTVETSSFEKPLEICVPFFLILYRPVFSPHTHIYYSVYTIPLFFRTVTQSTTRKHVYRYTLLSVTAIH